VVIGTHANSDIPPLRFDDDEVRVSVRQGQPTVAALAATPSRAQKRRSESPGNLLLP
jgi:hypothetical protein